MSQAEIDPAASGWMKQLRAVRPSPELSWAIAATAFLPLLVLYFQWLWRFEHYQFFPFLLAGVGYLAWTRVGRPLRYPHGAVPWTLLALSLCVLVVSSVFYSPRVAALGFLILAASFFLTHQRFYLWVPLILLIRLPFGYDQQIIMALQGVTTRISSFLLDLMRVPHLAAGNTIELPDRELFVAEACSGVQSAFTIAFVALLVTAWQRRPLFLIPLYLLISLIWAVLCNTIRVTTIAFAANRFDLDLSTGWMHDGIGYASLLLAILLTFSTDALLAVWFHSVSYRDSDADNPVVIAWNWLLRQRSDEVATTAPGSAAAQPFSSAPMEGSGWMGWAGATGSGRTYPRVGLTAVTAVVSGLSAVAFATNSVLGDARVVNAAGEVLISPPADLLSELPGPAQFEFIDSMRGGRDPRLGRNADQWALRYGKVEGALVFSQPYAEWHDLNKCYTRMDWKLQSSDTLQPNVPTSHATPLSVSQFTGPQGTLGYLIFTGINGDGTALPPPHFELLDRVFRRCGELISGRRYGGLLTGDCTMLQLWVVTAQPLEDRALADLIDAVGQARERFAHELAQVHAGDSGVVAAAR